jgi:hypothetical protein
MGFEIIEEEEENILRSTFEFSYPKLQKKVKPLIEKKDKQTITKWWIKNDFVTKMINKMEPKYSEDIHSSVTYILAEIIARSINKEDFDINNENTLIFEVIKEKSIEKFINKIFEYVKKFNFLLLLL